MTRDQLKEIFDSDQVVNMLCDLWDVMQAWDDAVDGDETDHAKAYRKAMIDLPLNILYQQFGLPSLVAQAYYDWQSANKFELNKVEASKAYMLRAGWYRIVIWTIHCVYGSVKAEEMAPIIWQSYGETYEQYLEECYA